MVQPGNYKVYVGAYAEPENKSIYYYDLIGETGKWKPHDALSGEDHSSFQIIDLERQLLYTTCNLPNGEGGLASYRIDPNTMQLEQLDTQAVGGAGPCYVSLSNDGNYLFTANYRGGNVSVIPVEDGLMKAPTDVVNHEGSGPNQERQEGPHPHSIQTGYQSDYIFACDLGTDKIYIYQLDADQGKLQLHREVATAPGAGPRHMAFHPNGRYAYVINELDSTVTAYAYDAKEGQLTEIQTVSTLPEDFADENTGADIHFSPCGKYLYGSNRGHDSIVVYGVDANTGELSLIEHASTQGKGPRNFAITKDGKYVIAANQGSGSLISYTRDSDSGRLTPRQLTEGLLQPVCVTVLE